MFSKEFWIKLLLNFAIIFMAVFLAISISFELRKPKGPVPPPPPPSLQKESLNNRHLNFGNEIKRQKPDKKQQNGNMAKDPKINHPIPPINTREMPPHR